MDLPPGVALGQGRVFVIAQGGASTWVSSGGMWDSSTGLFLPPSSCTEEHAADGRDRVIDSGHVGKPNGDLSGVPPTLLGWLREDDAAHLHPTSLHRSRYWWRAQATAYLMRFPDRHLPTLLEMRTGGVPLRVEGPASVGFPLPRGSISMHIRHGDKGIEMRLVPAAEYYAAARKVVQDNPSGFTGTGEGPHAVLLSSPCCARASVPLYPPSPAAVFVSTEDEAAITEVEQLAQEAGWTVASSDLPRWNGNSSQGQSGQLSDAVGSTTRATLLHLHQLLLAVEADGFIGTRASNWCVSAMGRNQSARPPHHR